MKRVIVTGAAGFIGANVARRLLDDGFQPTLLTGPDSDCWRLADLERAARVVQLDLADGDAVANVVAVARPEWILHLAAHGAYSWQTDRAAILRTNVVGTANLLEAARRAEVEAFVNTGSSSEYGLKDRAPVEEDSVEPNSAYAVAKASATMLCRHVAEADGLNVCTLRLYSAYGPWEEPKRLIPALAVEGLQGRFPPLVDPQTCARLRVGGRHRGRLPPRRTGGPRRARRGLQRRNRHADDGWRGGPDRPRRPRDRRKSQLGIDAGSIVGHQPLDCRQHQDPRSPRLAAHAHLP